MNYGKPTTDRERYEQACHTYLRFVFNGAPYSYIRAAAVEVFKWTLYPQPQRRDDDTVH
jgi:hypothetical protein